MKKALVILAILALIVPIYAQETGDIDAAASDVVESAETLDSSTDVAAEVETPVETPEETMVADDTSKATDSTASTEGAASGYSFANAQSQRYTVISELGQADAELIAKTLDAYFELYTSYFHFDPALLKARLQVRSFADKESFDAYLTQIIGSSKDDFVYLHYPTLEKSELLVYAKDDSEDYALSLAHQAFVQYLKTFAPNAPLWLREGFAVYFEESRYDPATGKAAYKENLSWLETVKTYRNEKSLLPLESFLALTVEEAKSKIDIFYPQSWAFVSFLLHSPSREVNRLLWDSLSKIAPGLSPEDAQAKLFALASTWPGMDKLKDEFASYLEAKKTFPEQVAYGIELYNQKKLVDAAAAFNAAVAMNAANHVPYYYLGLIAYANKEYSVAEFNYKQSLSLGCEAGIGNYALGVNSFVQGRPDDARAYLNLAKQASPETYGPKADEVLARIK